MSFWIVNRNLEPPIWCATDGSSTYYVGQLVSCIAASKANTPCVVPLAVPAGVADTSNFQIPYGVIIGINNYYDINNATYGTYGTGVTTSALQKARATSGYAGAEGMYVKGDSQLLIQVERIFPQTLLHGNIYNSNVGYGTAPTVISDTGGADSTGYTSAGTTTAGQTGTYVANLATIYCRKGANAGLYRTTSATTNTAPAVTVAFPNNVTLGDQFVWVPGKQGYSEVYISGPGLYVDCYNSGATNNFTVIVSRMGLDNAGQEYIEFSFALDHFCAKRA